MDLETAATTHRLRTIRLEDGEACIPLHGRKKNARYDSNNPHAGIWGANLWYALVESKQPKRAAGAALAFDTTLTPQITDNACLMFGTPTQILALITTGPKPFRAMRKRSLSPEHAAKLAEANKPHRFVPASMKLGS